MTFLGKGEFCKRLKSIAMFRRYTTISPEDLKEAIGKI